jgi:excisionase family DNA binding protein
MSDKKLEDYPAFMKVEEYAAVFRISRGLAYELARSGQLPTIRLGRLLRIKRDALIRQISLERTT